MKLTGPTEDEVDKLADAMCMVLNDLAIGNNVCDLVRAHARVAMEPFLLEDYGELPDLDWAKDLIRSHDRPSAVGNTKVAP